MIQLSACIEMLFNEVPFYDRFKAAHDAGCNTVEFWGWAGKDLDRIKELKDEYGLNIAAMSLSAADPSVKEQFGKKAMLYKDSPEAFCLALEESIKVAHMLGVPTIICTTGQERIDATRYEQHANVVRCLKKAGPYCEDAGITLVLEPLNALTNHKGYFLPSSYEAFEIIDEAEQPNVKVLYDIYHQQISEGNLIPTITANIASIGHFHSADVPGRFEPGTGEINYRNVFAAIDRTGYDRYVGVEAVPSKNSAEVWKDVVGLTK